MMKKLLNITEIATLPKRWRRVSIDHRYISDQTSRRLLSSFVQLGRKYSPYWITCLAAAIDHSRQIYLLKFIRLWKFISTYLIFCIEYFDTFLHLIYRLKFIHLWKFISTYLISCNLYAFHHANMYRFFH